MFKVVGVTVWRFEHMYEVDNYVERVVSNAFMRVCLVGVRIDETRNSV